MNYNGKTKEQLADELRVRDLLDEERKESDRKYAIKLVERVLWALVGLILLGVVGAIIRTVIVQ